MLFRVPFVFVHVYSMFWHWVFWFLLWLLRPSVVGDPVLSFFGILYTIFWPPPLLFLDNEHVLFKPHPFLIKTNQTNILQVTSSHLSDIRTLEPSDYQTIATQGLLSIGPLLLRSTRPSKYRDLDFLVLRNMDPFTYWNAVLSVYRAFGLSDLRTIGPSVYRTFDFMGPRTIDPSEYWADTSYVRLFLHN